MMSIESLTEQGIKTALKVYTDTLAPQNAVTYRCFFLDDESAPEQPTEVKTTRYIQIVASPNVPTHHRSTFRDVPVVIMWATNRRSDKKAQTLASLYENCRTILDSGKTNITITGYSVNGVIIEDGGTSEIDENDQQITLPITVKLCGA
jgi:hypothetical protein